jgi:hypothetical protein
MKRITLLLALAGLLASSSQAADNGFSLELGSFGNQDNLYNLFQPSVDAMGSWGLSGTYALTDRVGLIGSVHHHQMGSSVVTTGAAENGQFAAAHYATLVGLGVKTDWQPKKWVQLYTHAQGLLYQGQIKLDADPDSRTNVGQLKASGTSVGAQWLSGVELQFRAKKMPVGLSWHLEMGYGVIAKHSYRFKDVNAEIDGFAEDATAATMSPGGFVLRSGLGVRF